MMYGALEKNYAQKQLFNYPNKERRSKKSLRKRTRPQQNKQFDSPSAYRYEQEETQTPARNEKQYQGFRSLSEAKRSLKQPKFFEEDRLNIFKQSSFLAISKMSKEQIRLPTLQKRYQGQQSKRNIVKIPVQKLRKLHPDEVKQRFFLKYQQKSLH